MYGRALGAAHAFGADHVTDHVRARLRHFGAASGRARSVVAVPGLVIPGRLVSARGYVMPSRAKPMRANAKQRVQSTEGKTPVVHRMTHMMPQGLAATESFLQHFKENFLRVLEGWSQMACSYARRGGVRSFIFTWAREFGTTKTCRDSWWTSTGMLYSP